MCLSSPDIPDATPPIDSNAEAAQKAYGRERRNRAEALGESDTDVVGSIIASQKKPEVSTQLKKLMGG